MFAASKTAGVSGPFNYIEDVFSTYIYTGTGATLSINNGIDLATKGGLVWLKSRTTTYFNNLFDTTRGVNNRLFSNTTAAQTTTANSLTAFNTNGFSLGSASAGINDIGDSMVSWAFCEQANFFDVVSYTGDGSNMTISHNLKSIPGCIFVKKTNATDSWSVYHSSLGNTQYIRLNATNAAITDSTAWNNTTPTSTTFTVGTNLTGSGDTYVAYLFASNAGGFGLTGTENVISCGSFTTDGSGLATVSLGYEPQWILVKTSGTANNWELYDNMRGLPAGVASGSSPYGALLFPNLSNAEQNGTMKINSTGFAYSGYASEPYIYMVIRRGPMKVPTLGTNVFSPATNTGTSAIATVTAGFSVDFVINKSTLNSYGYGAQPFDKLRGVGRFLFTSGTNAEASNTQTVTAFTNTGITLGTSGGTGYVNYLGEPYINWMFGRAPSFFDEVCYSGTGAVGNAVSHNLGVAPELMIIKGRAGLIGTNDWQVLSKITASDYVKLVLNSTSAELGPFTYANNAGLAAQPTSTTFTVNNTANFNNGSTTYVAYLFATCAGVSKVGTYTGNGTTQTINCGFTGGARFVLIKQTDTTGDWYTYDTARGMTTLTDPYLRLNSTVAEVATLGSVTTVATGFALNSAILADINVSAGTYIFLAIA